MRQYLLVLGAVVACAAPPPPAPPPRPLVGEIPSAVHWIRTSAEYRAATLQAYRDAEERMFWRARAFEPGRWGVVMDGDETLIDNSEYQRRRALLDSAYTDESWNAWVREKAAAPIPGAVEFTQRARQLGGKVVIVTNRAELVCEETRQNLAAIGAAVDAVLCRGAVSDKNPRFEAVKAGTAAAGLPPLEVILWVGDNIQDFPSGSQGIREWPDSVLKAFLTDKVVIPNPMYGSWERNPKR